MKICQYGPCDRPVVVKGFCMGHYTQQRKGVELRPIRERWDNSGPCEVEDCPEKPKARGYCRKHYEKHLEVVKGQKRVRKRSWDEPCDFEGCDNPKRSLVTGLCSSHVAMKKRIGELRPLRQHRKAICRVKTCETRETHNRGLCASHLQRSRLFNLSVDQLIEILDDVCNICGTDGADLHKSLMIDHDHKCCPEAGKSCGQCVRGLLCFNCNYAIGFLKDDISIAEKTIEYLKSPPWNSPTPDQA